MELQFQCPRFLISQAAPINEPLSIDNFVYVYLKKSTFCAILRKFIHTGDFSPLYRAFHIS